ncbi:alpha/beta fold hydrolase [Streptomyces sp. NPDC049881]|uniref:alpha/beta fold hydrolase n=1 Tax=Streptomyces sp. NPDC049881 TaxID=3155778 RepID=UPI003427EA42
MNAPHPHTLPVPGAVLHHEVRGEGPVLLLIPGGAGDAGMYAGMAPLLAASYTVVTYDPRGMSRSPLEGPPGDQRVSVWADDAHRLLDHVTPGAEASVFGSSSGAIAALGLLARHPERLRRVVAHEPPLVELLAEPAPHRALFTGVRDTFRAEGAGAAMERMAAGLGGGERTAAEVTELPPWIAEMAPRMHANTPYFLEHVLCPFTGSTPDMDALAAAADRLVPAAGRASRGITPLYGPAARLAELTDRDLTELPGGHLAAVETPTAFANSLLQLLAP